MNGGIGDDELRAGYGHEILEGGVGEDILYGGGNRREQILLFIKEKENVIEPEISQALKRY